MKTIIIVLSSAVVQSAAVIASGSGFDIAVALAIGFAACFTGMFASDCKSLPAYDRVPAKAAAVQVRASRQSEAGVEFATFATFNSMVG